MTGNRTLLVRTLLLWILLEVLAASQVRTAQGTSMLWSWLRSLAEPFRWTSHQVGTVAVDVVAGLRDTRRLIVDHRALRLELEEARARNLLLTEDREALLEAVRMLGSWPGHRSESVVGRCVFRDLSRGRLEIRTDSTADIRRDTPVLGADGLVGRVVRSDRHVHWVELLIHPAAAVAVQTTDGTVRGLVTGTGRPSQVTVLYVPRTADLLRGDGFVTSGADGIYPAGIPVARVTGIRESAAPFLEVRAAASTDLATLRVVLLLPRSSADRAGPEWR